MDRSVGWQANRPKAIIALNAETVEVRSGQAEAPLGLTTGAYSYEQAFQVNRELSSHAPLHPSTPAPLLFPLLCSPAQMLPSS